MNDSSLFREEQPTIEPRRPLGEELLPPVEQPSARFIIQLFVVPAIIVLLIVAVWLSFSWLVRRTALGPDKLIDGVEEGPSVARWQRASELADLLQNRRYASFRRDGKSAARLAQILNHEIDRAKAENSGQEQATLRYFLARALGEFEVQEGVDVLLKAAETKGGPSDELVRQGALDAIAVRVYNLHQLDPREELTHPDLEPTLMRLASDEDAGIRRRAAYALGQIATPSALKRLEAMSDDPDADTRYNAAVALAHHGNATAVATLAEMLDVDELTSVNQEEDESDKRFKRKVLIGSAISAVHALARQNSKADLSPVVTALERVAKADAPTLEKAHIDPRIAKDAARSLDLLKAEK